MVSAAAFKSSKTFISLCSFVILSSIFLSSTTSAQQLINPSGEEGNDVFVHSSPPQHHHHHYIPVLFTGPFNRRSIPLSAAAVVTEEEEQLHPSLDEAEDNAANDGYVVQKLFSNSNSNNLQQQRHNGAPLYPVVFSRKPNKVWAPHNLRVEHHQSFGNAMKQILMRMNYQG